MKYVLILVGLFSIRRVQLGYAFDDHLLASFISPWLLFNSVYSYKYKRSLMQSYQLRPTLEEKI